MCWIFKLSSEILLKIFSFLSAKTLLNMTETCKRLKEFVLENDGLWKQLCLDDFVVFLRAKAPFSSFFEIYQAVYKYDIVQKHIYGQKCQLTFVCDVFNLPDYLYHWCTLLDQRSVQWPLSRTILKKDKFKKMWGLQDADLVQLPPEGSGLHLTLPPCDYFRARGFVWEDGIRASFFKHRNIEVFHEAALQRCKKSVKRIEKKFTEAVRVMRAKKVIQFLDSKEYQNIKDMVIRKDKSLFSEVYFDEEEEEFLDEEKTILNPRRTPPEKEVPCRIGVDYTRGLLHKAGFQQIVNFSTFCKDLTAKAKALPQFTEEDITHCAELVYEELVHTATEKLIAPEEFMRCARTYEERITRVWEWQCEKGEEHQKKYRGQEMKLHQAYKNYLKEGDEKEFHALKTHFAGIEKLKKWLKENKWIEEIVTPQILKIVQGSLTEEKPGNPEEGAMHNLVCQYLKTGKSRDFDKTLSHLSKMSKKYLKEHKDNVRKLEESIPMPLRQ